MMTQLDRHPSSRPGELGASPVRRSLRVLALAPLVLLFLFGVVSQGAAALDVAATSSNPVLTLDSSSADRLQIIRFNVTVTDGPAHGFKFYPEVSANWKINPTETLATTKHKGPAGWVIDVSTSGDSITFETEQLTGQATPPTTFEFHVALDRVPGRLDPGDITWKAAVKQDGTPNLSYPGDTACLDANLQCGFFQVPVRTVGVLNAFIVHPAGASDSIVSQGEHVLIDVVVSNHDDLSGGIDYKLFAGPNHASNGDEANQVAAFTVHHDAWTAAGDNTKTSRINFTFSNTTAAPNPRNIVVGFDSITQDGIRGVPVVISVTVEARPRYNDTATTLGIPASRNLTARVDMGPAAVREMSVDVSLKNNGTSLAEPVSVAVRMLDASGQDQASRFQITVPSSAVWEPAARIWTIGDVIATGTVDSATTTSLTDTAPATGSFASAAGHRVRIVEGAGAGQARNVTSVSGSTINLQTAWTTIPDTTSKYAVYLDVLATGAIDSATASTFTDASPTAGSLSEAVGKRVRILDGPFAGQERLIASKAGNVYSLKTDWTPVGADTAPAAAIRYEIARAFATDSTSPLLSTTFTVSPLPCDAVGCSAAPPDGLYNFTIDTSFHDLNNRTTDSPATVHRRSANGANERIRVDSTVPSVTRVAPASTPSFIEFQRGGANQHRFELNITDDTIVDGSQVLFKVLDSTRRIQNVATSNAPCVAPDDATAHPSNQCVLEGSLNFTKQGTNYNITYDFSRSNRLGIFTVYALVTDKAGNLRNVSLDPWDVRDTKKPEFTSALLVSPASAEVLLGQSLTFTLGIKDEYGLKNPLSTGDPVNLYLRAFDAPTGAAVTTADKAGTAATNDVVDIPALLGGGKGIRFHQNDDCSGAACNTAPVTGNATWSMTVKFAASGTYNVTVLAADASPSLNRANVSQIQVVVKPSFSLVYASGDAAEQTKSGSQAPGSGATFTSLDLHNQGTIAEKFKFRCTILPETNASRATGCRVVNPEQKEAVFDTDVSVTIYETVSNDGVTIDPSKAVNHTLGVEVGTGASAHKLFAAVVKPTASARPGQVARVEILAEPLSAIGNSTVRAKTNVVEGIGVTFTLESGLSTVGSSTTPRSLKVTQPTTFPLKLRNPGNVNTSYVLSVVGTPPADWGIDFHSADARWEEASNSTRLGPSGSGGLNVSDISVTITAPESSHTLALQQLVLRAANATSGKQEDITFHFDPVLPSIRVTAFRVDGFAGTGVSCTNSTNNANCGYVQGGKTDFKINASIVSDLNSAAGSPSGIIGARALVTTPCATSCPNGGVVEVPLRMESATVGQADSFEGRNGDYVGYVNLTDAAGLFKVRVLAFEQPVGDSFTTGEQRFQVTPNPGTTAPSLTGLKVFEEKVEEQKVGSRYVVTFGANVTVQVTMNDANNTGSLTMLTKRRVVDSAGAVSFVAVGSPLLMNRTGSTTDLFTRQTASTYETTWRQTGTIAENGGEFLLDFDAFNAIGNKVSTAGVSSFINLTDETGPLFTSARLASGALSGDNLDIEVGLPLSLTATVIDVGEDAPGANVDPATVLVTVRRGASVVFGPQAMARVPGSSTNYELNVTQSAINATGTYTVTFEAKDKLGNLGNVTRTLQVLVNLKPQFTISPAASADGARYISSNSPLQVTVTDANVDPNATGAIVVTFQASGSNTSTGLTPTITGARPTITLAIPVSSDGSVTVTVTDTLGESNTTGAIPVRVDTAAPTGVAINVDPLDVTAGRVTPATPPFTISPQVRLSVAASDAGSGIANGSIQVSVRLEGGSPSTRAVSPGEKFTLADVLGSAPAEGRYLVNARALDRAGNGANATEAALTVDSQPPSIGTITPTDPLTVRVTDNRSGVRLVEVEWSPTPDGAGAKTFPLVKGSGDAWSEEFPAEARGSAHFLVRAFDNVGNTATARCGASLCSVDFGDRPPQVTVTVTSEGRTVQPGGVVRGNVTIAWTAQDPENAQVLVTVNVTGRAQPLVERASLVSSVTWDTTQDRDGASTITVLGDTGAQRNTTTFNVVVRNLVVTPPEPLPARVDQGASVLLAFRLDHPSKEVGQAKAIVKAGGQTDEVTLRDDGTQGDRVAQDGIWSASYSPRLSGANTVDVQVTYDDGQQNTVSNVAAFRVESLAAITLTQVVPIVVVGVLVVALGAVGLRRWK